MFRRVAIIGVGLIGGSLGLTLRKFSLAEVVVGAGRNPENIHLAVRRGALHQGYKTAAEAVVNAELVYLSTPVKAIIPTLKVISPYLSPGTIITDAGSTKAEGLWPRVTVFLIRPFISLPLPKKLPLPPWPN